MNQDDIVYITGHQHPDTDSVAAAVAYSFYKRAKGVNAVPCRLGELNAETKYLLKRFGFEEPLLLEDARKKLNEITLDEPISLSPETTIAKTLELMGETGRPYFGVVDQDKHLLGMVTKSDLVSVGLGDTALGIELLKHTSVQNIADTVAGTVIYDDEQMHVNGKVSIIALTSHKLANYEIGDRIVIVGDDADAQKQLIEKGAGVLIAVWTKEIKEEVLAAAKKHHCPIIISGHGSMNTSRYIYFAPPIKLVMNTNLITYRGDELAEDVSKKMLNYRFRSFPVVDENEQLIGYVERFHLMNYSNKKIILVDHNEFSQSVKAVEKAQLLEVLDHHRVNDFSTNQPVSFRSEIVGSTATIISKIFRENAMPLPANLAGLLLGALLSDTLIFQSPTTTQADHEEANILAALSGLDIQKFGHDMFTASADIAGKSVSDLIGQDIKYFEIGTCKTMISQIILPSIDVLKNREEEIQEALNVLTSKKNLDLCVLAITGILDNGSIFYSSGEKAKWMLEAYPDKPGETHSFQEGVLSRKKQIVPTVTEVISKFA